MTEKIESIEDYETTLKAADETLRNKKLKCKISLAGLNS